MNRDELILDAVQKFCARRVRPTVGRGHLPNSKFYAAFVADCPDAADISKAAISRAAARVLNAPIIRVSGENCFSGWQLVEPLDSPSADAPKPLQCVTVTISDIPHVEAESVVDALATAFYSGGYADRTVIVQADQLPPELEPVIINRHIVNDTLDALNRALEFMRNERKLHGVPAAYEVEARIERTYASFWRAIASDEEDDQ